jgi:hypothetical protein
MSSGRWSAVAVACALVSTAAVAEEVTGASPRDAMIEFKLGSVVPRYTGVASKVLTKLPMLVGELEIDHQFYQRFGSLALGFSVGYGEEYGKSLDDDGNPNDESAAIRVVPLKLLGVYRLDLVARRWGIPLVPYAKAGLIHSVFSFTKGSSVEVLGGQRAIGGKWGYQGTLGVSLQLDFLEPRMARDFDTSMGVNHSYLFAEYTLQEVNNFGSASPLDLSSRHWMFGLALEY